MTDKISLIQIVDSSCKLNFVIESILNQTHQDFEYLIYIKNKDDKLYNILNTYGKDARIVVYENYGLISKPNIYNFLIDQSSTNVIVKITDSYIYSNTKLENQLNYFNNIGCKILGTGYETKGRYHFNDSLVINYIYNGVKIFEGTEMFCKNTFIDLGKYEDSPEYFHKYLIKLINKGYPIYNMREVLAIQ